MAKPITPDLVYELTSVSGPSLSPDGLSLAFALSKVDKETMESCSQIMLMDLPNGEARPFTQGTKDSSPKFSPDGNTIAFLRPDDKERPQLWLIPLSGGEARQLSHMPGRVTEFAWAPDWNRLVFVSDVDPDRPADDHNDKVEPRVRVVRRVKYRADTVGWRGDAHSHLFVMGVEDEAPRQITRGDWDDSTPVWSPDGTHIAFISGRSDDRDFVPYNEVYVVSAQGGEPVQWSQELSSVGAIAWAPDGNRLAVVGSDDDDVGAAWQGWIFILEPDLPPRRVTDDSIKVAAGFPPIAPPPEIRWIDAGDHQSGDEAIVFLGDSRGESFVFEAHPAGCKLSRIAGGNMQLGAISMDANVRKAAVLAISQGSPGDLHLVEIRSDSMRRLTSYNREYLKGHSPARMEKFSVSRNGMEIECRLLVPPDFDDSSKYPLILDIHGGPHGAFYDAFNAVQQVLATAGYLVLCVNPRGSSTYGADFLKAVLRDWGGEDYLDIMAAVDEACTRSYVDTSRLGVHGYSYGGFMSSWIVGHDTRFRAAVVGAPCIDLPSMYGTSDIGVSFGERQWGGTRQEAEQAFRERSPLTYAANVETPVLLLHGEADVRCPIEQSEQYFVALKRLGKEVEFVRFPGCSHLFLRSGHPKMREEYLARTLAWFNKHLGAATDAKVQAKAVAADG